jgi:hypothetical protein
MLLCGCSLCASFFNRVAGTLDPIHAGVNDIGDDAGDGTAACSRFPGLADLYHCQVRLLKVKRLRRSSAP